MSCRILLAGSIFRPLFLPAPFFVALAPPALLDSDGFETSPSCPGRDLGSPFSFEI